MPRRTVPLALCLACALLLAACGGSSHRKSAYSNRQKAYTPPAHKITTEFATPHANEKLAYTVLHEGGVPQLAEGLPHSFRLPTDLHIKVINGFDQAGPHYDPSTKTVTLSYGFVNYMADVMQSANPDISERDLGEQLAAVNDFILMHELGHAFIDVYNLPVLGKEEDGVDALATVFMAKFVPGGDNYAIDAAQFFDDLSQNPDELKQSDFWDEHSLDQQRAYSIICWVAGSSQKDYNAISSADVIAPSRLQGCPQEYQQKVGSWFQLLKPHLTG